MAGISVQTNTQLTSGGVYESVDLGLPSGTLWAKYNVGATSETDFGDLFAWGATEPYRLNGTTPIDNTNNYIRSYASTIKHDLYPNEDASTVKWGKGWRMPTKAQFEELINNITGIWTSINGINGYKFTASNGNYVFFPAAGYIHNNILYYENSQGYYMSRTLFSSDDNWRINFNSGGIQVYSERRYNGISVRPVRSN